MKVLGILYGKYVSRSRGAAPASQEQFVEFLNTTRPSWEKIVSAADQLTNSPRDGQPLIMLYGDAYTKQRSSVAPYVAYEAEGVDGMR